MSAQSNAQAPAFGTCKPTDERTGEVGCWILVEQPIGRIDQTEVFWTDRRQAGSYPRMPFPRSLAMFLASNFIVRGQCADGLALGPLP
jgi:hypothetical protein